MAEPAPVPRTRNAHSLGPVDRLVALAGGPVLLMTTPFGPSRAREAAYQLRARRYDVDLKLSWLLFANLVDWGNRWPAEQNNFAAGVVLTPAGNPIVERAVGRCLADLYQLGRPLLWGVISGGRIRWYPRFQVLWTGWPVEVYPPPTRTYARLGVAPEGTEFCPQFDPILYSADQDYLVSNSRLFWLSRFQFGLVNTGG